MNYYKNTSMQWMISLITVHSTDGGDCWKRTITVKEGRPFKIPGIVIMYLEK